MFLVEIRFMKDWSHAATLQLLENWRRCGIKKIPKSTPEGVAEACEWLEQMWAVSGSVSPNAKGSPHTASRSEPHESSPHESSPPAASGSAASETAASLPAPPPGPVASVVVGTTESLRWSESSLDAAARENKFKILSQDAAACRKCADIVCRRKQTVFGAGPVNAKLVMFGEAPGAEEDRTGQPFVGAAGQLMDRILVASGLRREDVYIMNSLKCRPPDNRTPTDIEIENCRPFFEAQLETIQPEYIICWGAVAVRSVLKTTESIGRLRGRFHRYKGAKVLVTYHPSYLLRNPDAKRLTWEDMKFLMKELGIPIPPPKKQ